MQRTLTRMILILICVIGTISTSGSRASPILFSVDTSVLAGRTGTLAFDFIGDIGNTATIASFQTSGSASPGITIGNTNSILPSPTSLITGTSFFNEVTVDLIFGSLITFKVEMSQSAPGAGGTPDALSLFFLDSASGLPMFSTSDPTGANALFMWSVDGSLMDGLSIYQAVEVAASAQPGAAQIPEPASVLLILPVLAMLIMREHLARLRRLVLAAGVVTLSALAVGAQAQDLSGKVSIAKSGGVLNRTTETFDSVVTVTNTSSTPISAPLKITVKNITKPGVSVYNSRGVDKQDNAQVTAPLDLGALQPGAKVAVAVKFVNRQRIAFDYTVSASGAVMDAANATPLTVKVHAYSGDDANPVGAIAGAGVKLYVDGVLRGVTNAAGEATFLTGLDTTSVSARRPPSEVGTAEVSLVSGQPGTATVVLADDGEVYADGDLRIDQVQNLLLPNAFAALSIRFVLRNEGTVKLVDLALVELFDSVAQSLGDLTQMFTLGTDGVIRPIKLNAVRNLFANQIGKITLKVTALDAEGNVYLGNAPFHIARYPVSGKFAAPPSFPGLQLGGIRIVGKILNTDIVVSTVSNSDGTFIFPNMPNGNLSYSSETFQNGKFYYGEGTTALTGPANISVPLLSAADTSGTGFAALSASLSKQAPAAQENSSDRRPEDLGKALTVWPALPGEPKALTQAAAASSATVSVTAQTVNQAVTQSATLTVPKGTTKVTLTYNVSTIEYPYYVTQQSIHNDVWGIKVFAGAQGSQIFNIIRQVNSQLTQAPVWQTDGTTGVIEQSFDVAALAKDGDMELTLTTFATNIGDSQLPTTVNAKVENGSRLTINAVSPLPNGWIAHNDNTYFSVPASGDLNQFHRSMKLDITKPDDATIANLKVEVVAGGATSVALDEAPGGNATTPNASTVPAVVTFKTNASSINGVPPPSSLFQHKYTLKATAADGSELSAEKLDTSKRPLWRMPGGFARYSTREPGHDDWASQRTYNWMVANAQRLNAINDVSGEHGKDLDHDTHGRGSDIDMYHFYMFPGAAANSGTSNYNMLLARVLDLPKLNSTNPAVQAVGQVAQAQIVAWINASHAGIDALAADPDVLQIGYIRGGPNSAAIADANWGQTLLTTGRVTVNGVAFNLGTGAWNNAKYHAWANHHHHVHLTLNPAE